MALDEMQDLYPVPFPEDVPIANINRISLKALLDGDEEESQKIFDSCTTSGFFYLDMMDHEQGRRLWHDACQAARSGMQIFPNTPISEKKSYKAPAGVRVLDRGYQCGSVNEDGVPRDSEMFMIPQHALFGGKAEADTPFPEFIAKHLDEFKNALASGNVIANVVLGILAKKLGLETQTLTRLHQLEDSSGDFLRVLRYPGAIAAERVDPLRFPAHKDAVSVAILFTWLGGLQILDENAPPGLSPFAIPDEYWRWVKPLPGTAIVNLGDCMEVFSNGVLKSALHRVIKAPGLQLPFDKYSVLLVARPEDSTPMRAFESSIIPLRTAEQAAAPVDTSIEWGNKKIRALQDFIDKLQSARAGKSDKLERSW